MQQLQEPPLDHGAAWHRRIDPNVMRAADERWVDFRVPENYATGIMKSLLAIAQLQTHDPIVLQRYTGYPLRFLGALVNNLVRLEEWLVEEGYIGVIEHLKAKDDRKLDSVLSSLHEVLMRQDSESVIYLPDEWYISTGVPPNAV
jgi:hypothetical protein